MLNKHLEKMNFQFNSVILIDWLINNKHEIDKTSFT